MRRRTVTLVQRVVPPYRLRLFELVRDHLAAESVDFHLIAGTDPQARGGANTPPPWAELRRSRSFGPGSKKLEYQPVLRHAARSDLVILEQASKDIHTALLLVLPFRSRIGLWGHGRNLQASTVSRRGEAVKRHLLDRADWFWAYTPSTTSDLIDGGFPADRITTLTNTVDGTALRDRIALIDDDDRRRLRADHGIGDGPVILYLTRMYDLKRPAFAVESAFEMRQRCPDLTLVSIGDGPLRHIVADAASAHDWIVDLGELHGAELGPWLDIADLLIQPGMVGLAAVDALASGVPVASIEDQQHSPEFSYLEDGTNSIVLPTDTTPEGFGAAVAELLTDRHRFGALRDMVEGHREGFKIETMANDFAAGVIAALAMPNR